MFNKKRLALATAVLAPAMAFSTAASGAASNADLSSKIEMLESQLAELRQLVSKQGEQQQQIATQVKKARVTNSPDTTFTYGGFIKADTMWTEYSDTDRAAASVGDDFLVPSLVPVGNGSGGGDALFDAHAKNSRFWLKTVTETSVGNVTSYFEMDFNSGADERITNQASNGLRHAFLKWDYSDTGSLLAGQTWSTFFNTGALPEAVDFIGPTAGTLFNRQYQVRWTRKVGEGGSFMLAVENPSSGLNEVTPGSQLGMNVDASSNNYDDNERPDIVLRYNGKAGGLDYSIAGISREVAYDLGNGLSDSANGFALSLSGKYQFSNGDDLKFMINHGNLGRYIALNAFRDGFIEADGDIDLLDVTGGFIAYRHKWSDKWRSTVSYAMSEADNPSGVSGATTESVSNYNVNLMYSPTKNLTFGTEYIHAEREVESGLDGDMKRLQFMGKWAF